MLLLMGGAGGLPFMEDAEDLIDGLAQLAGYNTSVKQWRRQALQDIVGDGLAEFIESGVSGLPGAPIDISGRLGSRARRRGFLRGQCRCSLDRKSVV